MQLTVQIRLRPTKEQENLLDSTTKEYISLVNDILDYAIAIGQMPKLSSASVCANIPSTLRCQCVRDASSIYRKTVKFNGKMPTLKKPVAIWNNQNYSVLDEAIAFPMLVNGRCKKVKVKAVIPSDVADMLHACKLGAIRITRKGKKWVAQIAYEKQPESCAGNAMMGIDLGIKCPAVAVISDGTTKFYGNGRQNNLRFLSLSGMFWKRRPRLSKLQNPMPQTQFQGWNPLPVKAITLGQMWKPKNFLGSELLGNSIAE